MDLRRSDGSESRFSAFVEGLVSVIGHADRARPLFDYCVGLIMPGQRKSVEPMAAVTAPDRTAAQHQSLLHFVGQSPWSDEGVLAKVGEMVLPAIGRHGPIEAWIIDDTGFPKKGAHSVGVARQYCGQLGKQDNCQVAVSLSLANAKAERASTVGLHDTLQRPHGKLRLRLGGAGHLEFILLQRLDPLHVEAVRPRHVAAGCFPRSSPSRCRMRAAGSAS
jgi:DDE superfamily endonuclease